MTAIRTRMPVSNKLLHRDANTIPCATTKPNEYGLKHRCVPDIFIKLSMSLFDLPNDHVRLFRGAIEPWIGRNHTGFVWFVAIDDELPGIGKMHRENIEICTRSGTVRIRLNHRIFRNCEISVDVQVCVHQANCRVNRMAKPSAMKRTQSGDSVTSMASLIALWTKWPTRSVKPVSWSSTRRMNSLRAGREEANPHITSVLALPVGSNR